MALPNGSIRYYEENEPAKLRQPSAIIAFGGWIDAGSAGTGAIRFLVNALNARKYADVDPEEFYSFTDTRPLTSVVGPGQRAVHWPRGEFFTATLPDEVGHDLVLFVAPEPNLKWRTFASVLIDVLERLGVTSVLSVGSIFGTVHHRSNVPLTGWATETKLRESLSRLQIGFNQYEGPTGFVTVLLAEAQARNLSAGAIVGFAPNYIQGVPNPRVSHALLKAASEVTGSNLPLDDIARAGRALVKQVDQLLSDQPELKEQVERMLSLMEVTQEGSIQEEEEATETESQTAPPPAGPLPSPQAVVRDLEEFLKTLREQQGDGGAGPTTT